jgi:hypothetical protein
MNAWDTLAERKLLERVADSPEGRAFAFLVGTVEGFGRDIAHASDEVTIFLSDLLAAIVNDAFNYYEKEVADDE